MRKLLVLFAMTLTIVLVDPAGIVPSGLAQVVLDDGAGAAADSWGLLGEPPIGTVQESVMPDGPMLVEDHAGELVTEPAFPVPLLTQLGGGLAAWRVMDWSNCHPQVYFGIERIHFWTRGMQVPALVTTSPPGTPLATAGVLGQPTTRVLFGDERFPTESEVGRRFTLGVGLGQFHRIEAQYFQIDHVTATRQAVSPTNFLILARPYRDAITGLQTAALIGYPGIVQGQVDLYTQSDLHGFGLWGHRSIPVLGCPEGLQRIDFIMGYRNLDFDDRITIDEHLVSTNPTGSLPVGSAIAIQDEFRTENEFNGLDLGLGWRLDKGKFSFLPTTRLALGNLHQEATIVGSTRTTTPTGTITNYNSGLLALDSNSGVYEHNEFVFVPEVNLNLYYHLSDCKRFFVGYTMLMIPKVMRASGLIDTNLDPGQIPPSATAGLTSPAPVFRTDEFWAQGIHFGCEFEF